MATTSKNTETALAQLAMSPRNVPRPRMVYGPEHFVLLPLLSLDTAAFFLRFLGPQCH